MYIGKKEKGQRRCDGLPAYSLVPGIELWVLAMSLEDERAVCSQRRFMRMTGFNEVYCILYFDYNDEDARSSPFTYPQCGHGLVVSETHVHQTSNPSARHGYTGNSLLPFFSADTLCHMFILDNYSFSNSNFTEEVAWLRCNQQYRFLQSDMLICMHVCTG